MKRIKTTLLSCASILIASQCLSSPVIGSQSVSANDFSYISHITPPYDFDNPSKSKGSVEIHFRGDYSIANVITSAPLLSVVDGVEVTIKVRGGTADDLEKLYVYICRNEGTNCRQFSGGPGTVSTVEWDESASWAGGTELSPGWEVWTGVMRELDDPEKIENPILIEATISMGWRE